MNTYITSDTATRLWAFIESLNTEVGGFGYASLAEEDLVWHEVFLVPQEVSKSEVDFEGTGGDAAAIEKAADDGMLGMDGFVWVSWHSHHTMKAFWSGTDDDRIEAMRKTGIPALLSFVGCHDHSYKARLDLFHVGHLGITVPQVTMDDLRVKLDPADAVYQAVNAEIVANVVEKKSFGFSHQSKGTTKLVAPGVKADELPGAKLEKALETAQHIHSVGGMDDWAAIEDARDALEDAAWELMDAEEAAAVIVGD